MGFEPVTSRGSNPVEVLNFFRLLYAIVKIGFVTAKIVASLDFISAVRMIHLIYHFIFKFRNYRNYSNWPFIVRIRCNTLFKSWSYFGRFPFIINFL